MARRVVYRDRIIRRRRPRAPLPSSPTPALAGVAGSGAAALFVPAPTPALAGAAGSGAAAVFAGLAVALPAGAADGAAADFADLPDVGLAPAVGLGAPAAFVISPTPALAGGAGSGAAAEFTGLAAALAAGAADGAAADFAGLADAAVAPAAALGAPAAFVISPTPALAGVAGSGDTAGFTGLAAALAPGAADGAAAEFAASVAAPLGVAAALGVGAGSEPTTISVTPFGTMSVATGVGGPTMLTVATAATAIPAGALIVVPVMYITGEFTLPTAIAVAGQDTQGNAYQTILTSTIGDFNSATVALVYCFNCRALSAGDTISVEISANGPLGGGGHEMVAMLNGTFFATGVQAAADPHDGGVDAAAAGLGASAPSVTAAAAPTDPNSLIVGVGAGWNSFNGGNPNGNGAPWTNLVTNWTGFTLGLICSYVVASDALTFGGFSVSQAGVAIITAFKPAPSPTLAAAIDAVLAGVAAAGAAADYLEPTATLLPAAGSGAAAAPAVAIAAALAGGAGIGSAADFHGLAAALPPAAATGAAADLAGGIAAPLDGGVGLGLAAGFMAGSVITLSGVAGSGAAAAMQRATWPPTRAFSAQAPALRYGDVAPALRYSDLAPAVRYGDVAPEVKRGEERLRLPDFPPMAPLQRQTLNRDFGNFLPAGTTLTGTPTATLSVISGSDPDPASRITVPAEIRALPVAEGGTGLADTAIALQVYPGPTITQPVTYLIEFLCARSDGDSVEGWCHLPVIPPH